MSTLKVLQTCTVSPSSSSDLSLPLLFFDILHLKFPAVVPIFFFSHSSDPPFFDFILPKLKQSLSLALSHFLPLAGNLILHHPPESSSPELSAVYKPGDGVSLVVAEIVEAAADHFNHLSGNRIRDGKYSHGSDLVPRLNSSDTSAAILAVQITVFPGSGYSIAVATHHGFLDGKSSTMFLKAWACICKQLVENNPIMLSPELTPSLDRTAIEDLTLDLKTHLLKRQSENFNMRITSEFDSPAPENVRRGTFELTGADIEKLRKRVGSYYSESLRESLHLSSFVLSYAYIATCIVQAQGVETCSKKVFYLSFGADWRPRLNSLIPLNYVGNGVVGVTMFIEPVEFMGEEGVANVAKKIGEEVIEFGKKTREVKSAMEYVKESFMKWKSVDGRKVEAIIVVWSPRFSTYETDFGWGKAKKVEIPTFADGNQFALVLLLTDSRDGNGVEVSFSLPSHVMERFLHIFSNGLQAIVRPL